MEFNFTTLKNKNLKNENSTSYDKKISHSYGIEYVNNNLELKRLVT